MFNNVIRGGGRGRNSTSKTSSYWATMAYNVALNGALSEIKIPTSNGKTPTVLAVLTIERNYRDNGMTPEGADRGGFNYSLREVTSKASTKPPVNIDAMIRDAHNELRDIANGDADVPDWSSVDFKYWGQRNTNGSYRDDVPNPDRCDELNIDTETMLKRCTPGDTVCDVVYRDRTDDMDEAFIAFLRDNLTDEPMTWEEYNK